MSSTGRGPRLGGPDDFYVTPSWVVDRLLDVWTPPPGTLLEPAAGDGAIIRAINARIGAQNLWVAVECRATAAPKIQGAYATAIADFLTWEPAPHLVTQVTAVITNPPFKDAEAFVRRASDMFPEAALAFLVRLGFLASEERISLWRDLGAPDVFVLPNRPSFTPNGATDSSDYAWIVLPPEPRDFGVVRVLASTSPEVRGKRGRRKGP